MAAQNHQGKSYLTSVEAILGQRLLDKFNLWIDGIRWYTL